MHTTWPSTRLVATVLIVVLLVTFSAPARAEADVLTALAIVGVVIVGVMIVAYLVIANVKGSGKAEAPEVIWIAAQPAPDTAAP